MSEVYSTDLERSSNQFWHDSSVTGFGTRVAVKSVFIKVKLESLPAAGETHMFWGFKDVGDGQYLGLNNTSGTYRLRYADGAANKDLVVTPSTGTWYSIGFTRAGTGSNQVATYFESSSATHSSNPAGGTSTINNVSIGNHYALGATASLDGQIAEMRVWSRALTSTEFSTYRDTPCDFDNGASLVSWWEFNNDGTDSIGVNDLTNDNSATFVTDVPYTCSVPAVFTPKVVMF